MRQDFKQLHTSSTSSNVIQVFDTYTCWRYFGENRQLRCHHFSSATLHRLAGWSVKLDWNAHQQYGSNSAFHLDLLQAVTITYKTITSHNLTQKFSLREQHRNKILSNVSIHSHHFNPFHPSSSLTPYCQLSLSHIHCPIPTPYQWQQLILKYW